MDLHKPQKRKKIFLLVCEGPTDFEVIKSISNKISKGSNCDIEVRELSPTKDKTTEKYPPHGWTGVKGWCERYKLDKGIVIDPALEDWQKKLLEAKLRFRWDSLLKVSGADGIIVQIDTDIAEQMSHAVFNPTNDDRKEFCRQAVNLWLNEVSVPDEMYYLLSTYSSEVWLLAAHEPLITTNYESLPDAEDRLIGLGYSKKKINGKYRLKKDPNLYKSYSEAMVEKLDVVRERCLECELFCCHLAS
ncbi:hypothetical protein [Serratia ureilytica]|uniref:hypothetical protein n=1 Tax=Serratia ureilytica TaxID=300181 RepID=UPI0019D103C0|nr:hypothetical protein [Serratia ureilytica]MBN5217791.1 hypothetical protein [Serratia ureilytica]